MTLRAGLRCAALGVAAFVCLMSCTAARNDAATPGTTPPAAAPAHEEEVSFVTSPDTIYGSLLVPPVVPGERRPAAVLLAGSGPTDRNGDSALIPGSIGTLRG